MKDSALPDCNYPDDPPGSEEFITSMPDKMQRKRKPPNELGRLMTHDAFCKQKLLSAGCMLLVTLLFCVLPQSMVAHTAVHKQRSGRRPQAAQAVQSVRNSAKLQAVPYICKIACLA